MEEADEEEKGKLLVYSTHYRKKADSCGATRRNKIPLHHKTTPTHILPPPLHPSLSRSRSFSPICLTLPATPYQLFTKCLIYAPTCVFRFSSCDTVPVKHIYIRAKSIQKLILMSFFHGAQYGSNHKCCIQTMQRTIKCLDP